MVPAKLRDPAARFTQSLLSPIPTPHVQRFYLKTNALAPRYRVVAADFAPDAPHTAAPRDADDVDEPLPPLADTVPQAKSDVLDWATVVGGRFLLTCSLRDVVNVLRVHVLPATPPPLGSEATALPYSSDVPLPGPGTIASFSGRRDQPTAFVKHVSFLSPGTILRLDFDTRANEEGSAAPALSVASMAAAAATATTAQGFSATVAYPHGVASAATGASPVAAAHVGQFYSTAVPGFDASAFESRQVFVPTTDRTTNIPLFIVRKKGGEAPAAAPTLMYGCVRDAMRQCARTLVCKATTQARGGP